MTAKLFRAAQNFRLRIILFRYYLIDILIIKSFSNVKILLEKIFKYGRKTYSKRDKLIN